ncbi:hypothetical protein Q8F55_002214 [Vanrija albida]|uniref:Uncharacterized protein n=1 Tax=Vanrija albida TaxID=181172 RepID=A0ABR3Q962_9TREE
MTATTTTTTSSQPIPQAAASTSAASTPSASPLNPTNMGNAGAGTGPGPLEDRLNALLSSFDIGTHGLCREERRTGEFAKPQTKLPAPRDPSPSRSPLLSLLSLTRPRLPTAASAPSTPRGSMALPSPGLEPANPFNAATGRPQLDAQRRHSHFDPGREPKLHGLF